MSLSDVSYVIHNCIIGCIERCTSSMEFRNWFHHSNIVHIKDFCIHSRVSQLYSIHPAS
jgi:hypothetical protein